MTDALADEPLKHRTEPLTVCGEPLRTTVWVPRGYAPLSSGFRTFPLSSLYKLSSEVSGLSGSIRFSAVQVQWKKAEREA